MVFLIAALVGLTLGAAQLLVDTDEVFPAEYVEDFELDGNLAKDVWKKAEVLPGQRIEGGKALPYKDEIRLLYSRTALYVGVTLWQVLSKPIRQGHLCGRDKLTFCFCFC